MRPGRLTLVLLALTAVLLIFPEVRRGVTNPASTCTSPAVLGGPLTAELQRVAQEHPGDSEIALGVAEAHSARLALASSFPEEIGQTSTAPVTDAYEKALELDPQSPVVHLRAALYHVTQAGKLNRRGEQGFEGPESPRSEIEAAHLKAAERLLRECRGLAPDNAACDYWLAWTLFAQGQDGDAFVVLEQALGRQSWTTYYAEAVSAVFRVCGEPGSSPAQDTPPAIALTAGTDFPVHSRARSLARLLIGLGEGFRDRGEHEQAILCFRACAHLGHAMRVNTTRIIEGLVGVAISEIASGPFVSESERAEVRSAAATSGQSRERLRELRLSRFDAYLRRHGHADFAAWYAADLEKARAWQADAKRVPELSMAHLVSGVAGTGALYAAALYAALLGVLAVACIVWLISLIVRYWREPRTPPVWGYVGWFLLLALCLVPGQAAAFLATRSARASVEFSVSSTATLMAGTALGVLLWIIVAVVVTLARYQAQPGDTAPPRGRAALAGLRALVLPTLAALLFCFVLSAVPVRRGLQHFDQERQQMTMQNEVQCWGVGTGDVRPHPRAR